MTALSWDGTGLKPGWLTSEFWLTVVANVLTQAGALQVPDKYKWAVTAATLLGYAISRGLAKAVPPKDGGGKPEESSVSSEEEGDDEHPAVFNVPSTDPSQVPPDQGDPGQPTAKPEPRKKPPAKKKGAKR